MILIEYNYTYPKPQEIGDNWVQLRCRCCMQACYINCECDCGNEGDKVTGTVCCWCGDDSSLELAQTFSNIIEGQYEVNDDVDYPEFFLYQDAAGSIYPADTAPTKDDLRLVRSGCLSVWAVYDKELVEIVYDEEDDKLYCITIEKGGRVKFSGSGEVFTAPADECENAVAYDVAEYVDEEICEA